MSNIRKIFTSRFANGVLLEVDYSQLEVFVLAHLSGDPQLKEDLLSGIDIHGVNAELLFGSSYTPEERRLAKALSFQLQYGAGAASMARENGTTVEIARQFIEHYYTRYPMVRDWQLTIKETVDASRISSPKRTKSGRPAGIGQLVSSTRRIYKFTEKDAPPFLAGKGITTSFSPTEIKNYPVQGLATGDIMPIVLGKINRVLMTSKYTSSPNTVLLVNTVHDSILFDCEYSTVAIDVLLSIIKPVMENAPNYLKEIFNIDFDLPLKIEAKMGKNWKEVEKI